MFCSVGPGSSPLAQSPRLPAAPAPRGSGGAAPNSAPPPAGQHPLSTPSRGALTPGVPACARRSLTAAAAGSRCRSNRPLPRAAPLAAGGGGGTPHSHPCGCGRSPGGPRCGPPGPGEAEVAVRQLRPLRSSAGRWPPRGCGSSIAPFPEREGFVRLKGQGRFKNGL